VSSKNEITNDQKIRQLFGEIHTPSFDILEGVRTKMERKQNRRPRAFKSIVFAALILILTTGVVFAAYQGTGGFARLRGIVGDERADNLTPIEMEEIVAVPYLTGGFRNPHEDRFAIELVAIYGEVGGMMDFYFTLEDLTGARHTAEFNGMNFAIQTFDETIPYVFGHANEIIDNNDGILTLRGRTNSMARNGQNDWLDFYNYWSTPQFIEGYMPEVVLSSGMLNLTVTSVSYNAGYVDHRLGLDLAQVPVLSDDDIRVITNTDLAEDFPEWMFIMDNRELLDTTGVAMPRVGLNNWEIDHDRVGVRISSIGIIGDSLHIIMYEPLPHYSNFSGVFLVDSNGDRVWSGSSMLFSLCENGNFYDRYYYRDTAISIYSMGRFSSNPYQLLVFDGLDLDNLGSYRLEGIFDTGYSIWLEWTAIIDLG